jgi:hypothetical protein
MTPGRKTRISATVWIVGILLCVVFVGGLLPMEGPLGHQWGMPWGVRGTLFFVGGCCLILTITSLVDNYWPGGKTPN